MGSARGMSGGQERERMGVEGGTTDTYMFAFFTHSVCVCV